MALADIMPTKPAIIEFEMEQLEDLLRRTESKQLCDEDYETIKALTESYVHFVHLVGAKTTTIARLRKMLFGAQKEKTDAVLGDTSAPTTSPVQKEDEQSKSAEASPRSSVSGLPAMAATAPRPTAGPRRSRCPTSHWK